MNPVTLSIGIGDIRPTATLHYGQDVRQTLQSLPTGSVHTVCTSPPYYGLRDYNREGQIGLESTPQDYVRALVEVFREVKRVLRPDGTLWLNLGDSYSRSFAGCWGNDTSPSTRESPQHIRNRGTPPPGLKDKELIGIPWRVAFALQEDGWYLRQDIIWAKPNPMPESVTDRCTKAHEYIFLLTQSPQYYFDAKAIRVEASNATVERNKYKFNGAFLGQYAGTPNEDRWQKGRPIDTPQFGANGTANRRSVWSVTMKPYAGAHFATWPPDLVQPMILAGTSAYGVCANCGAQWIRETEWKPACGCVGAGRVPATVLDPFSGSGTTGMVALREGRNYTGIDLNDDYLELATNRIQELPAPTSVENTNQEKNMDVFDLFGGDE